MRKRIRKKNNVKGSWSDLPDHLLLTIFDRLDRKDVLWRVSSVCRSWQLACWDFFFWTGRNRILKLNELESLCNSNIVEDEFDKLGFALKKVIDSIFKYNAEILEHTHRHFYHLMISFQLSDKLLVHVAERTPNLQRISLNMHRITGTNFSTAILNWRELRKITMGPPSDSEYTHVIQEIGINCGKLRSLYIVSSSVCFVFDEDKSHVIAKYLPNLEKITLANCYIYKLAVQTILIKCSKLQCIKFRRCRRALEDIRITRSRRAFAANPPRFVQDPLTLKLSVVKSIDVELVSDRQRQGSGVELVSDKQRQGSGDEQKDKKYAMFTMDVMWILTAEQMQKCRESLVAWP